MTILSRFETPPEAPLVKYIDSGSAGKPSRSAAGEISPGFLVIVGYAEPTLDELCDSLADCGNSL
jgi:hypothetical protein